MPIPYDQRLAFLHKSMQYPFTLRTPMLTSSLNKSHHNIRVFSSISLPIIMTPCRFHHYLDLSHLANKQRWFWNNSRCFRAHSSQVLFFNFGLDRGGTRTFRFLHFRTSFFNLCLPFHPQTRDFLHIRGPMLCIPRPRLSLVFSTSRCNRHVVG